MGGVRGPGCCNLWISIFPIPSGWPLKDFSELYHLNTLPIALCRVVGVLLDQRLFCMYVQNNGLWVGPSSQESLHRERKKNLFLLFGNEAIVIPLRCVSYMR